MPSDPAARLERALRSLDGLSVGDAFGDQFFAPHAERRIAARELPPAPWRHTDDTAMALSIVDVLREHGTLDPGTLAGRFADRYARDPERKYGAGAHEVLTRIGHGESWRHVAGSMYGGAGSMGNGGAMRSAPIGAYFADDLEAAASHARQSAAITHANLEAQAGAVAVAVAAGWATRGARDPADLFRIVLEYTPESLTRAYIQRACSLAPDTDVRRAVSALGNGTKAFSQDTVPFALWCVSRHLGAFEEALWTTVSGLGDRDTTCAIVGGILAADPGVAIPLAWLEAREPLEEPVA